MSTYGENKLIRNLQRIVLIHVDTMQPSCYALDLDFLHTKTGVSVSDYKGAYFLVKCGLRNSKKTLALVPGVHVVLADSLEVVAIGPPTMLAVFEFRAIASCVPTEALPQWESIP